MEVREPAVASAMHGGVTLRTARDFRRARIDVYPVLTMSPVPDRRARKGGRLPEA